MLAASLVVSTATAQPRPPTEIPPAEVATTAPAAPAVPMRFVVFSPDRANAALEFYGIGLVEDRWQMDWFPACIGPCSKAVPIAGQYRVGGPGFNYSRKFSIGPGSEPLHVEAKIGSSTAATVGTVFTVLGGTSLLVGFFTAGSGYSCGPSAGACDGRAAQRAIGLLEVIAGAAALVGGGLMLVSNQTSVLGNEFNPSAR